jgi:hypothetical protein
VTGKHKLVISQAVEDSEKKGGGMTKKEELLGYLNEQIFDPILNSPRASNLLKQAVRLAVMRMNRKEPDEILQFYSTSIIGGETPTKFALQMKSEGFTQFEEVSEEFRNRFNDRWLNG